VAYAIDRAGDPSAIAATDHVAQRCFERPRLHPADEIACRGEGTTHAPVAVEHEITSRPLRDRAGYRFPSGDEARLEPRPWGADGFCENRDVFTEPDEED
jgi:hypothetical protein